jgi:transposase InsO family protein
MCFDMICGANGIEHRLTKPNHPWTNGQVERMNRTVKDATVKRFHYDDHAQLRTHLTDFLLRRGRQSTGLSTVPSSPTTSRKGSRHWQP